MHTAVHAPRAADVKLLYACTVDESDAAENEESLEPEDRLQRPRAGSVTGGALGTLAVLRTRTQTAMFTCGVARMVTVSQAIVF